MIQLKNMLKRLKNPSVVLSIVSQVITVMVLLNIDVDKSAIMGIVTTVCSVFTLMGIMSNPDTKNKGYLDDVLTCTNCNGKTVHVKEGEAMVCVDCGTEHVDLKK